MPAVNSQQFLKGAAPSWDDGTPYYTGLNPRAVEAAHQVFIRAASKLLREWPRSHGLRAVATNFQVCLQTAVLVCQHGDAKNLMCRKLSMTARDQPGCSESGGHYQC